MSLSQINNEQEDEPKPIPNAYADLTHAWLNP